MLEIKDLTVHYETADGVVEAVNNVSLNLEKGQVLGLVGETGAGKTTIAGRCSWMVKMFLLKINMSCEKSGERKSVWFFRTL